MKNGQRVICINDDFDHLKDKINLSLPKFGVTYTIREMCLVDGKTGLLLTEIVNDKFIFIRHGNEVHEPIFHTARFIPAIGKENTNTIKLHKLD